MCVLSLNKQIREKQQQLFGTEVQLVCPHLRLKSTMLTHFLYRIIRAIIMTIQGCFHRTTGKYKILFENETVELGTIIYKRKIIDADVASPTDFIWITEKFVHFKILLQPNWSLYTIDENYAYFILMPKPAHTYTVDKAPFVYMKQFGEGLKLAKCTLKNFCKLTETINCQKGPVIYETSSPRAGSTLMAQLLQSTTVATVLGEPDALTVLTNLIDKNLITTIMSEKVLGSIFKFLCKFQSKTDIYVIKTRSNCIRLVPIIKKVCPQIKHFFMFRKCIEEVLASSEKMLKHAIAGEETIFLWNRFWPELCCWLIHFANFEYKFKIRFGMKDCLDYAILINLSPYYEYIRNRELFDLPCIYMEDLVRDPPSSLIPVLKLCEIPLKFVKEAMKGFNKDSQSGTILSQKDLQNVSASELSKEKVEKITEICNNLEIETIQI